MLLPMESAICETCHQQIFAEWKTSEHAAKGLDCYDCHQAHSQGLRIEGQNELCSACHANEDAALAHSVHGITGVNCSGCHMTVSAAAVSNGAEPVSNHTFTVASDVCMRCHSDSVHSKTEASKTAAGTSKADAALAAAASNERVLELEAALNAAEARNNDLRNLSVMGMGLTFGVGGVLGLVVGVMSTVLLGKRKKS
ncbi:MAG: hypothetical protein BWY52_00861 [Chloroflexi bacterium ADurb.Bin325]|nr:MAG: hypothetical protein BWY52_00861 [Chloroflexi bacterium ADurb.Bin325]